MGQACTQYCWEAMQVGAHAVESQALSDIESLKVALEGARVDRKHKEEYEVRFCRLAAVCVQLNPVRARSLGAAQAVSGLPEPRGHASRHRRRRARYSRAGAGERSDRGDGRGVRNVRSLRQRDTERSALLCSAIAASATAVPRPDRERGQTCASA